MPRFTKTQRQVNYEAQRSNEMVKIGKARRRYYIVKGGVISLNHMFLVPRGYDDIRMVYKGTSSGINDTLWDPHSAFPTVSNTLRDKE